jgi:hypothetical protein
MSDSGVPDFTEQQLEEYLSSGDADPIFETSAGLDSFAEIYELNGRLILKWTSCEWTETGFRVLDTDSLDEARSLAESQASDLASDSNTNFDQYLELGSLAGFGSQPDRFYPLPEDLVPICSYTLVSNYDNGEYAEIVLYSKSVVAAQSTESEDAESVLAFSTDNGLVVGEFESLEKVQATVMEEPAGFTLEFYEWAESAD